MRLTFGPLFRAAPAPGLTPREQVLLQTLRAAYTRIEGGEWDQHAIRRIGFTAWLIQEGRLSEGVREGRAR